MKYNYADKQAIYDQFQFMFNFERKCTKNEGILVLFTLN